RARGPQLRACSIPGSNQNVADETVSSDALDRGAGEEGSEGDIVERQEENEFRCLKVLPRSEFGFGRDAGKLVPRANGQAIVAAIDPVADRGSERVRYGALVLDREVGDAAARVELIGRRES